MNANIQHLEGKYYGTIVETKHGYTKIWISVGRPSSRQLAKWGILEHEWTENKWDDGNKPKETEFFSCETPRCIIHDSHYESEAAFKAACIVVEVFRRIEIETVGIPTHQP